MKKIISILAVIIVCQLNSEVFAQSKTAHVDTKILMDTLPSRKAALVEIQEVTKRGQEELIQMDKEMQKAYSDYMAAKDKQSAQVNQYEEGKIQKMQQDLQKRDQELATLVQGMTDAMNQSTFKLIQQACQSVAAKKKYDYVFDGTTAIVANGPNVTNEAIVYLLQLDSLTSSN